MRIEKMLNRNNEFLSSHQKANIDELAETIADYYFPRGSINPEIIAESYNISYSYGLYKDDFDGLLEHMSGRFHIYINNDRLIHPYTERARFTFAHELGHYFIDEHRNALAKGLAPSHSSFTGFKSENKVEREADYFAACLLLPKSKIINEYGNRKFQFTLIQELAKKYQTSFSATAIRYAHLGIYPIMVICCHNHKIKWYTYTLDFPFKSLKHGKEKVPSNTVAGEYFSSLKTRYAEEEIVYAEDWFILNDYDNPKQKFKEQCLCQGNWAISILW